MKPKIFAHKTLLSALTWLKTHWKTISITLIMLSLIIFWRVRKMHANQPQLKFIQPQLQNLTKTLEVSGVIDAKEKATLRFAAGGKIVYLGAKEGDTVKKYQTIATIDQRSLKKQLQQNLNNYAKERWDWETTQDGTDYPLETLDTRRTIDQEQWDLNNTVLDVEINDIAITNTVLSAPFAGVLVSSPTAVAGVNVLATEGFKLVNPQTVIFKAAVDEAEIAAVKKGQSGVIYLDAYPDQPLTSNANYIAYQSSQTSTGTVFVVEFPLEGKNLLEKYRLGMNGDVKIKVAEKNHVLAIPIESTREREGKIYVDVRTQADNYQEREITTGLETEDKVEVLSGLSENDEVLVPEN